MKKGLFRSPVGRVIYWVLLSLLAAVFLLAAFMIGKNLYEARQSARQFEEVTALVDKSADVLTPIEKYGALKEVNEDLIGWIRIEGTRIDYPVMQTKDRPDYYLRRGLDKEYSYYGVPYASEAADVEVSDNVVIYGHHMNNGSMFSNLKKYTSREFYEEHRYIQFDTLEAFGTYEILAVFKVKAGNFNYHLFADAASAEEFDQYIAECKSRAYYDTGVTAAYGDRLITLSTCEYTVENGRLVVVAKRISESKGE